MDEQEQEQEPEQPQQQAPQSGSSSNPVANQAGNAAMRNIAGRFAKKKATDEVEKQVAGSVAKKLAGRVIFFELIPVLVVIGIIIGTLFLVLSSGGETKPSDTPTPGGTAIGGTIPSGTPATYTGNLASCAFTRSDQSPTTALYKSPTLLSYFQEASTLSSVPPQVVAAIARVESPSIAGIADEELSGIGCAISGTGALGLMQIQPPKQIHDVLYARLRGTSKAIPPFEDVGAYDGGAVGNGARMIGKTPEQLTEADMCNLKNSITIATGFILKKISYPVFGGYGDGTKWDPSWTSNKDVMQAVARSYYGCSLYGPGGCTSGPYSYGNDLYAGIHACVLTAVTPSGTVPPVGNDLATVRKQILDQFNIDMATDFSLEVLRWSYESFGNAKSVAPQFFPLLKEAGSGLPIKILPDSGRTTETFNWKNPPEVTVNTSPGASTANETLFKAIIIHELGHVIHGPAGSPRKAVYGKISEIRSKEGGLTGYGDCNVDEDFAESVSYFINLFPEQVIVNSCPKKQSLYPFGQGRAPLHYQFMKSILNP